MLELRSQNDFDLHVEQVRKNLLLLIIDYPLSSLDTFRVEIILELKKAKYCDLEDLVYRFHLTYDEIIDILDIKYSPKKRIGYSKKPNIYQTGNINTTLKHILLDNVKINVTIGEKR